MSTRIGRVQRRVLDRAHTSQLGCVMPAGYLERRACRRLARRGLLFPKIGLPDVWGLW